MECEAQSGEWQAEQQRIRDEANQKRSEVAKQRGRAKDGTFESHGEPQDSSSATTCGTTGQREDRHEMSRAKALASRTNRGAVERGNKLVRERPDLAEKVRNGEMRSAEAHRIMQREAASVDVRPLPPGKYNMILADPPWRYEFSRSSSRDVENHYSTM